MNPLANPASRNPHNRSRSHVWRLALLLVVIAAATTALGQDAAATSQPAASQAAAVTGPESPETFYGAWVLIPPIVTIILAIVLRQVIPALCIGILVAAYMLVPCAGPAEGYTGGVEVGLRLAVEQYLVGALANVDHVKILIFSLTIGAMVGVIEANGGTRAIVNRISRFASSRERGQLTGWFAGLLVFFDDYANAMIVGPSMRPVFDRLRISRAKLAYVVDSTAAPVASIALVGTWIGLEISLIQDGLDSLQPLPAVLDGVTGYGAFWSSIPYRFYAILALVMVLLVGWLGRDFGPMRTAECRAPAPPPADLANDIESPNDARGRAWYALVPVLLLVAVTVGLLGVTGWSKTKTDADAARATITRAEETGQSVPKKVQREAEIPTGFALIRRVISKADSFNSILYGSLAGIAAALAISFVTRSLSVAKSVDAATGTMSRMFPTFIVLVLAWSLAGAMDDLHLGSVAATMLQEQSFNPIWLPFLIFVSSCVVSFATGTSWGTMGILCPATVTISASLLTDLPAEDAMPLFYASVGAVLAGAVFGDHCSPISDTTVLSSLASECSLEQHVWTQMPYALTVAGVSIICGDILCRYFDLPVWLGLLFGSAALLLIVLVVGRKPEYAPEERTAANA